MHTKTKKLVKNKIFLENMREASNILSKMCFKQRKKMLNFFIVGIGRIRGQSHLSDPDKLFQLNEKYNEQK